MSEQSLKLEARLTTLEYMLQRLYMITYGVIEASSDQIKAGHRALREKRRTEEWPTTDPAQAALISGELEDAFDSFLSGLETMLEDQGLLQK